MNERLVARTVASQRERGDQNYIFYYNNIYYIIINIIFSIVYIYIIVLLLYHVLRMDQDRSPGTPTCQCIHIYKHLFILIGHRIVD